MHAQRPAALIIPFAASALSLNTPLQAQLNGRELGWAPLNRLCWAIGSISGSMVEDQENRWVAGWWLCCAGEEASVAELAGDR